MRTSSTATEPTELEALKAEVEFLRFFYDAAGDAFGPADSDIYRMIGEDYEETSGHKLPSRYREDE